MKNLATILVVVLVVFLAVADATEVMTITEENLALLQGKWEGERSFVMSDRGTVRAPVELEFLNTTFPLKVVMKVYYSGGHSSGGPPETHKFSFSLINGKLRAEKIGKAGITLKWLELELAVDDGKPKLVGKAMTAGTAQVSPLEVDFYFEKTKFK